MFVTASSRSAVEVLICGAGPVGLSLAIELARHGQRSMVVEPQTGMSKDPKAKFVNLRTLELLRRWGIAQDVRSAALLPHDYPSDVVYANRLLGPEIVRLSNAFLTEPGAKENYPEAALRIPQPIFQNALLQHAKSLPEVELRLGCRVADFKQTADIVRVDLVDEGTGERQQIEASYLAGCDGARSLVRKHLGIRMLGSGRIGESVGAVFRAPGLWSKMQMGPAVHYWILNDDLPVMVGIGPLDLKDLWFFQVMDIPAGTDPARLEPQRVIRACLGEDMPCETLSVTPWTIYELSAEHYRKGRVFILGDAAHLHPPTGGFGMNMGIGDAVDLGWKLAATLRGWGGELLLDSFETERKPVHELMIRQSRKNLDTQGLLEPGLEDATPEGAARRKVLADNVLCKKKEHYNSIGIQLGYNYAGSPVCVADGTSPPKIEISAYRPSGSPGALAPHSWLSPDVSLFDTFGPEFTLLRLGDNPPDGSKLVEAAAQVGVPVKQIECKDPALTEAYGAALVLVRPDQHVAWRGGKAPQNPRRIVDIVRGANSQDGPVGGD